MEKKNLKKNTEAKVEKLIIAPKITEKASVQSEANAYTFVVSEKANKTSLLKEIKSDYKVTPTAINITRVPGKRVFVRGKFGRTAPTKKAIVFLKKGDTIALSK